MKMTALAVLCAAFCIAALYFFRKGRRQVAEEGELQTFEEVLDALKAHVVTQLMEPDDETGTDGDYQARKRERAKKGEALKNAGNGVPGAKMVVKELIREFVEERLSQGRVDQLVGLDGDSVPSHHVMFEIIMHRYKQRHGAFALSEWIFDNRFEKARPAEGIHSPGDVSHYVSGRDLEDSYARGEYSLTPDERIEIFVTLLYEAYKGFGILDTVAEMKVNGYNLGVSGPVMETLVSGGRQPESGSVSHATNALWLYLGEKYVHLQFLDFGSEDEIRRIIQMMVRYNSPGPLTAKRGYIVNYMAGGERVMAMRPPVGECWAAFVRKSALASVDPTKLIIKEYTRAGEVCVKLLQFVMWGLVTLAVTGRQGSGKTSLMKGLVGYYDPCYNIRVLEMAPELYLREYYPTRNIFSAKETPDVCAEDIQDAFKKADSSITIIGEVATQPVAARTMELTMTGSICTLFSHHANTAKDLVLTLRNALVNAGGFDNMQTAEKQVTDAVKLNVHIDYTKDGKRFIRRVTEIVQLDEGAPYPEYDEDSPASSMAGITREYYARRTDRVSFECRDVLTYDTETDTYRCGEEFSASLQERIMGNLDKEKRKEFQSFLAHYWRGERTEGYEGVTDVGPEPAAATPQDGNPGADMDALAAFLSDRAVTPYGFGEMRGVE